MYLYCMCDWVLSDSLGEQLLEVGSKWAEAEVPWEAHQELVRPVPAVSMTAFVKLLSHHVRSSYPLCFY